jgi:hypothetical protein
VQTTASQEEIDNAKMAVIIDCEGTIGISSGGVRGHYQLQVAVGNYDFRLLEWCKARFGGAIYPVFYKVVPPGRERAKRWMVTSFTAANVLQKCLPHFIMKKEQADIALEFQATFNPQRTPTPVTEALNLKREELMRRLQSLTLRKGVKTTRHDERTTST